MLKDTIRSPRQSRERTEIWEKKEIIGQIAFDILHLSLLLSPRRTGSVTGQYEQ